VKLADFQRDFLGAILSDEGPRGRVDVYRRNVLANQHDALAATYPVVRRLVGEAFFREAARRYASAQPSPSGDLHRHGGRLADFLEGYEPARQLPYLPDAARLDWAVACAFHDADPRQFDYPALNALGEEDRAQVRLRLQPAARIVASSHPIVAIWEANQSDRDGTPDRAEGADTALVYREEFTVRVSVLDPVARRFLEAVRAAATLGEMAGDAAIGPQLGAQLVNWTRLGVIDGF
jgi:hypothetical protein